MPPINSNNINMAEMVNKETQSPPQNMNNLNNINVNKSSNFNNYNIKDIMGSSYKALKQLPYLSSGNYNNTGSGSPTKEGTNTNEDYEKKKLIEAIERLKVELKKEKTRNHKTQSEFNKIILEKNQLENIFKECVDEVRKDIINRKLKDAMAETNKKNKTKDETQITIPYLSDVKFDKFTPKDKKKLVEIFVTKEGVAEMFCNLIFNKPKEGNNMLNLEGINILNENRLPTPNQKEPNVMNQFNFINDKKLFGKNNIFARSTYSFTNKKGNLNFGRFGKF